MAMTAPRACSAECGGSGGVSTRSPPPPPGPVTTPTGGEITPSGCFTHVVCKTSDNPTIIAPKKYNNGTTIKANAFNNNLQAAYDHAVALCLAEPRCMMVAAHDEVPRTI